MRVVLTMLLLGCQVGGCADRVSRQEYAELVADARVCVDGSDSCALAGAGECTCPMPVNAAEQGGVDEAAEAVQCDGAFDDEEPIECSPHTNVRCEGGRCISDESEGT